ncbi:putative membrane protein [Rhodopirellula europaea 6C]|uniref:Putative membrane protein n=2 Tax=Rhodopirellula TaxID=265488 RepID=M2AYA8_9BACT|nr:putative membrane protein [Rhodopirellula europaea 6C]
MNSLPFQYGPTFFLYSIILGLMLTAVIFRRIIQAKSDNQLMAFGDAVSLASLYYTISFLAFVICGAVVFLAIAILLSFIGG